MYLVAARMEMKTLFRENLRRKKKEGVIKNQTNKQKQKKKETMNANKREGNRKGSEENK